MMALTHTKVALYTKPSAESFDAAISWLRQRNLLHRAVSHAGDWLQFSISVEKANEYFGANFSVFTHTDTGSEIVRTLEYSLPAELTNHIKILHPTLSYIMSLVHRTDPLLSLTGFPLPTLSPPSAYPGNAI
jgi:tripeptidyl-peptidase-1